MKKIYLSIVFMLLAMSTSFAQCTVFGIVNNGASCFGTCDGSATAFTLGGTGSYTYVWMPGNFVGINPTNLCAGSYTVTATDAIGCKATSTPVVITEPAAITLSFTNTNPICNGGNNGSAIVNTTGGTGGVGGFTYSWNTVPVQTLRTASNLKAGIYTITVTDGNGCKATGADTITQPVPITITTTPIIYATCGKSDGQITANASNGVAPYTYAWNTTPPQSTAIATALPFGTYTVVATDQNGCKQTATASVKNINGPAISITSTDVSCFGGTNGTASAIITGGTTPFTFSWNSTPVQTTATATGLPAKTYTCSVTDKSGCMVQGTVIITQPAVLAATTAQKNVSCKGGANGRATVTVTGGTAPYSYSWNTAVVQTTDTAVGLVARSYNVVITDGNGCTISKSVTITEPATALSTVTTIVNVSCNGGSNGSAREVISGGTPAYTYLWNTIPVQTLRTASNLKAGIYTLTATDGAGCKFIKTDTITQPSVLSLKTSSVKSNCGQSNGSATVTVSGGTIGYSYSWNTNPAQTKATAAGLPAGIYIVTVTDTLGCIKTAMDTVKNLNTPVLKISSSDVSCFSGKNGTASVKETGGTGSLKYSWSSNPIQTTATATGLIAGSYTVTITDSIGCSAQASVVITQPTALASTNQRTNVTCNGGKNGTITVKVTGGTSPYTALWNPSGDTSFSIKNLPAGNDTIAVTDGNGCQLTRFYTITEPLAIAANIIHTNVSCNGGNNGSATVTASGGTGPYTYSWDTKPAQTNATASNLIAGTYTVTVKDANTCTFSKSVIVTEPLAIALTTTTVNSACGQKTGQIAVTASGGASPYTYSWNSVPAQTTATDTTLAAGIYTVTVKDSKNCIKTASDTVKNPNAPMVKMASTDISCFGSKNGTASITATGGTAPLAYSWNTVPVQTTPSLTGLSAGSYTATVTDKNSCANSGKVTIAEPAAIAITVKQTNVSCNKLFDGSATATVTGGTIPYTYLWSVNGSTTATAKRMPAGKDTITITDGNGCSAFNVITITQPAALSATIIHTNVSCNSGANGSATVAASGGTGIYTYSWDSNPAQTTSTAIGLSAGTYTVTVKDTNACSISKPVTITEPLPIAITPGAVSSNCGQSNGQASATVSGGTVPYTYSWNTQPAQTTSTITGLAASIYTVTVTDNKTCKATASVIVNNLNAAALIVTSTNVSCFGGANGTASVTATGGTGNYSYSWNSKIVQTTAIAVGLSSGSYVVTVTDGAGCKSNSPAVISQPTAALSTTASAIDATCLGCKNGSATVKVSGGTVPYTYTWTPSGGTSANATGLGAGKYKVCVTDKNGCGICDSVVIKEVIITGINNNTTNTTLNVYPNPNDGSFIISLDSPSRQLFSIKVMSPIGQVVSDLKIETDGVSQIPIDITNVAKGMYFIKIQSDKELLTKRIFIK